LAAVTAAKTTNKQLSAARWLATCVILGAKHMPIGPKGQKRPADVISNAVKVMRIATGEEDETLTEDGKNKAAVTLGRLGGKARADRLGPRKRKQIATVAAKARWKKSP
jgi:hypothetical protein